MPAVRVRDDEHGRPRFVRRPYHAWSYSVPAAYAERMAAGGYSILESMAEYDGPFRGFGQGAKVERGGSTWVTLFPAAEDWAIDVELSDRVPARIEPLPPWQAWALARAGDPAETEIRALAPDEEPGFELHKKLYPDLVMPKPRPPVFAVPDATVDELRRRLGQQGSRALLVDQSGKGPLANLREVQRFEREGKRWVRLIAPLGWVVDLELTDGAGAEVRPLPEAEARRVALDPTPPSMPPFPRP